jgi:hypothetical protein
LGCIWQMQGKVWGSDRRLSTGDKAQVWFCFGSPQFRGATGQWGNWVMWMTTNFGFGRYGGFCDHGMNCWPEINQKLTSYRRRLQ